MSIVVEQLEHRFAAGVALRDVAFSIPDGEIVALIGPNGAGKSTLLRIIASYIQPTQGRVRVAGIDIQQHAELARRSIGYLPEQLPSEPGARIHEYLHYRAALKQITRRDRSHEVDRCLEACDLLGSRHRIMEQLSHGFRRRVGLADALLGSPRVLLLDEPTEGLDPLQICRTRELLRGLAGRSTVLVSTHLLSEAELLCQRALLLFRGSLVSDLDLKQSSANFDVELELNVPAASVGTRLRESADIVHVELISTGVQTSRWLVRCHSPAARVELIKHCVDSGWGVLELVNRPTTLEQHLVATVGQWLRAG